MPWPLIKVDTARGDHPRDARGLLAWALGPARKDCSAADPADCLGLQQPALDAMIKHVVSLFTQGYVGPGRGARRRPLSKSLADSCPLLKDTEAGAAFQHSVQLFDFSVRHQLERAAYVATADAAGGRAKRAPEGRQRRAPQRRPADAEHHGLLPRDRRGGLPRGRQP